MEYKYTLNIKPMGFDRQYKEIANNFDVNLECKPSIDGYIVFHDEKKVLDVSASGIVLFNGEVKGKIDWFLHQFNPLKGEIFGLQLILEDNIYRLINIRRTFFKPRIYHLIKNSDIIAIIKNLAMPFSMENIEIHFGSKDEMFIILAFSFYFILTRQNTGPA